MKIALYVEDGLEQIVLTPETETEKAIVGKMHDEERELSIHQGSFYGCQGGYMRHPTDGTRDDKSTIIVLRPKSEQKA